MTTALAEWDVGASHSNYSDSPRKGRRRRVLVVGAGVSGVAAAKTFLHAAPHAAPLPQSQLLVLEQNDSLGGVWARGRAYPGLASNGPRGLYGLAGHELWDPPTRPISRLVLAEEISGHLESYAKKFGVLPRVVFGTRVDSIVPCFPCGEKPPVWHVSYSSPDRQGTIEVDFVVVATGIFSIPRLALDGIKGTEHAELLDSSVPQTTAQPKPKTLIIHGSHLSQPEIHSRVLSAKGRILIVGYGKSALDISTHLALLRPDVSIVFREAHWFWPFHSYDMATRKSWEGLKPWYEHRSWTARWLFETRWGEQRLEESRKRYEGVLRRVYGLSGFIALRCDAGLTLIDRSGRGRRPFATHRILALC